MLEQRASGAAAAVETLEHPFVTLNHAAYFLGTSYNRVQAMYGQGALPEARLADGTEFRPGKKILLPAISFRELLDMAAREEFDAWQRGELEIPSYPTSTGADRRVRRQRGRQQV